MLFGAPRREWLTVFVPPSVGGGLAVLGATKVTGGGWAAYLAATVASFACAAGYSLYLARRRRLFLRDPAAIEENRLAIARTRSSWLLAVAALVLVGVSTGWAAAVAFGALGGALLGFSPGLAANFWRLRREAWSKPVQSTELRLGDVSPRR